MARPLRFKNGVVQFMVRLPTEVRDELQAISARDGIPVAEQIRRAVSVWVQEHPKPRVRKRPGVSLHPADATDE